MPTLSITKTYADGNVLTEADLDAIRTSLTTFFNTTKIDGANIQTGGVPRAAVAAGTLAQVVINDPTTGALSSEAQLAMSRGGMGLDVTPQVGDGGKVLAVKSDVSGYQLVPAPESPISRVYAFNHFS